MTLVLNHAFSFIVLRRDLINEEIEAPSASSDPIGPQYYDGPFDFTFSRREPDNSPSKLWKKIIYHFRK